MTKKQKFWLTFGIVASIVTTVIIVAGIVISFSTWIDDWERELFDRSEALLAEELGTEWVDAESISEYKDGKDYFCRAEVYVRVDFLYTYVVHYEKPAEDAEWVFVRYEKE